MEEVQYFWAGTLQVNDLGEHSLFHIKDRKVSTDYPVEVRAQPCLFACDRAVSSRLLGSAFLAGICCAQLELSTDDLPPAPVRKGDVLRVALYLESNVGTQTVRYKVRAVRRTGLLR